MTIQDALLTFSNELNKANIDVPSLEVEVLLCFILKKDKVFLYTYPETPLSTYEEKTLGEMVEKRKTHYPLAYLTHNKEFYKRNFYVDERVLIPRPETELLVSSVIEFTKEKNLTVADIGTGSGCIAITLAKELSNARVIACDISKDALDVAKKNASNHQANITFFQSNLLSFLPSDIDVIVANLPYLKTEDLKETSIQNEPKLALDGSDDGLLIYETLFEQLKEREDSLSAVFLEIGFDQMEAIKQLQIYYLPEFELTFKKDYAHIDRIAILTKYPS